MTVSRLKLGGLIACGLAALAMLGSTAGAAQAAAQPTLGTFVDEVGALQKRRFSVCVESLSGGDFLKTAFVYQRLMPIENRTALEVADSMAQQGFDTKVTGDVIFVADPGLRGVADNPMDKTVAPVKASGDMGEIVNAMLIQGRAGTSASTNNVRFVDAFRAQPLSVDTSRPMNVREFLLQAAVSGHVDWVITVLPKSRYPAGFDWAAGGLLNVVVKGVSQRDEGRP